MKLRDLYSTDDNVAGFVARIALGIVILPPDFKNCPD